MDNFSSQSNNPQIQPVSGKLSRESLRTKELADLTLEFEQLLDNMTEENYDTDVIDAYLEALEEKEKLPKPEIMAPEIAYQDLKRRTRALFSEKEDRDTVQMRTRRQPRHTSWKRYARYAMIMAATICLMFALMIGVQAAGFDVFGNLAQWTDEALSFILPTSRQTNSEYYPAFQEALREHELPAELAPAWYPEGFQTDGPVYEEGNPFSDSVHMDFSDGEGRFFSVVVDCYFSSDDVVEGLYQKDSGDVELYTSKGRTFYIMSNQNTVTAVWASENLVEMIEGFLSVEETKQIIDSIGGNYK